MNIENKLKQMGIEIKEASSPVAAYVNCVRSGQLLFISGKLPVKDGKILYKGKVGKNLSVEEAQKAAELCIIEILSVVKAEISDLDKIKKIVKITGYIQSADDFYEQHLVLNGASNLLLEIFGREKGTHSRAALGMNALPLNSAIEIDAVVEIY